MIGTDFVTRLGVGAFVIVVFFSLGVSYGAKHEREVFQEQMAQYKEAEKHNLLLYTKQLEEAQLREREAVYKAEKESQDAIKKLKHDYAVSRNNSLYVTANCPSSGMSSITTVNTNTDAGATTEVQLSDEATGKLLAEAERADTLVEQFRALQHWLVYQGFYKGTE